MLALTQHSRATKSRQRLRISGAKVRFFPFPPKCFFADNVQFGFRCDILPDAANKGMVDFDDFGFLFTFAINMARASDRGLRTQCRA